MKILDEIETEAWHILTSIYTYQRLMEGLTNSATRFELANQLVALNALLEMLVIRIARLADKRKDSRSVSMLVKRGSFPTPVATVEVAADNFILLADPVVKIRHERVAHMKPGVLSSYEPQYLPAEVLRAAESLINLLDITRGKSISYKYKVGSMEPVIDLRESLTAGKLVSA
ncbi:hypothetical protein [Halomonas dongshanensis]|uniref:HEPN AbiU2-like domain-containing protein n=1 Tax=Halomonas dongshanensis TaxID=2890835 RepID=A0ABT2EDM1_9GAMM|nr:hypothetical protein [Halomonas dongshanensis]MCS2609672.1 hypothetical protein [Halomonas dongshanensis]